jgi:glucose-6-phosphate 1-dehydrogenase
MGGCCSGKFFALSDAQGFDPVVSLTTSAAGSAVLASDAVEDLTSHEKLHDMPLAIVIFGATGDLARKKLFPALYQLCLHGHLPLTLSIVGYGRKAVDMVSFIEKQCVNIKEDARLPKASFVQRISFHAGAYDEIESFERLDATLRTTHEQGRPGNRLFFLSVPPTIFGDVCRLVSEKARAAEGGFTRLYVSPAYRTWGRWRL